MRVKLHSDGYNEIIFKPSTNKVVIGINKGSWYQERHISFKAKTREQALTIGIEYVNKHSKVKILEQPETIEI